ncbi:transporter [bacterium]|nr:transporter [bacterium]
MGQSLEMLLLLVMLFLLMLGMGATLTLSDFRSVLKHPKAFLIGLGSQFVWMPAVAFTLCYFLDLSPAVAIGLIMLGCTPGGTTSNLFSYFAKGDVALSISMTVASTFLASFLMPFLMFIYAAPFTDEVIVIPYSKIVVTMLLVLLPVGLGVFVRHKSVDLAKKVEKTGSMMGVLVIAFVIVSWMPKNRDLLSAAGAQAYWAAILQAGLGFSLGFFFSKSLGLGRKAARTVSLETGVQNTTLTLSILMLSFPEQKAVLLIPMLFAFLVIVMASILTLTFRLQDKYLLTDKMPEGAEA